MKINSHTIPLVHMVVTYATFVSTLFSETQTLGIDSLIDADHEARPER